MSTKKLSEMTKAERIKLIVEDSQSYLDQLLPGELLQIADSIAKTGPIEKTEESPAK